jgi:NADH dehydrogenase
MSDTKRVVILGGGFGGIRTALDLSKRDLAGVKVTLISDRPHFEHYPTLYKVVTGRTAKQECVPLSQIFEGLNVEVVQDYIEGIDLKKNSLKGKSGEAYAFDYLVLALGSESSYFGIPGIAENSRSFKSIDAAVELREHLEKLMETSADAPQEEKAAAAHVMVVGGGPTGIEISSDLVSFLKKLAIKHNFDPSFITVDLVEAAPRLLPLMPPDFSEKIRQRLHNCGVNVYLDRVVIEQAKDELILKDMRVKTKTVIWTAGVKPNQMYSKIEGLELDKRGKVVVDESMRAKGFEHIFAIGDGASTQYSGMAQTADHDGAFVAEVITAKVQGEKQIPVYEPKKPIYAIPTGHNWAAILWGKVRIYGYVGSLMRHAADLRYFAGILPIGKAFMVVGDSDKLAASCPVCSKKKA